MLSNCVSVIIPVFNGENHLRYCLNACINQLDYIYEIIIIDDFSKDNSLLIANEYKNYYPEKIKVYANITKGVNNARNLGYSHSSGEFIQWLDSDDEILEGKLIMQLSFLMNNPSCDIVYSDWSMRIFNKPLEFEDVYNIESYQDDFLSKLLLDNWIPLHSYLMNRKSVEFLKCHGGWNVDTVVMQDREYFTLAALFNFKFCYVPGFFARYYRYTFLESISKNKTLKRYESLKNIVNRVVLLSNLNDIKLNSNQNNLLYTNDVLCKIMLGETFSDKISLKKIKWSIFPGRRLKIRVLMKVFCCIK